MMTTISSSTTCQLISLSKTENILEGMQALDQNLEKDIIVALQIK
jgi:hypothetical protein